MRGLMMDTPLLITSIMRHARRNFANREVVSVTSDNPRHRYNYEQCFQRAAQLANALARLKLKPGDRVGTLAWNDYRHLEIYYGAACSGLICHTINPRLFAEQLAYIINHAEDRVLLTDPLFIPLLEKLADRIKGVRQFIILTSKTELADCDLPNAVTYEEFIGGESDEFAWPDLEENTAAGLCYTSGTTGNPKGVLYSHRSSVLHAYAISLPDVMCLSARDAMLPVVPMFHVNAWGLPYACPMIGAKIVFPGPKMADGPTLHALFEEEAVTISAGVPTVWLALLEHLRANDAVLTHLQRVVVGGAACPKSIMEEFQDRHSVWVHHAWGMTEMSPVGTYNTLKPGMEVFSDNERWQVRAKQGRGVFGVEMKITDDNNAELPWNGVAFGALKVRGPWVCSDYYRLEGESDAHDADGWFETGDVATIDAEGFMQITDRTKDVIKSGGEWISSIELENTAVGHPAVHEAAVIGVAHPKWTERPLLVVVKKPDGAVTKDEILEFMTGKVAKWWLPDDVLFVDELPHTATGKLSKLELRERLKDYRLPE